MNRAVVRRTTAGLARYLKAHGARRGHARRGGRPRRPPDEPPSSPRTRRGVLAAAGIPALVLPGARAHAARRLRGAATSAPRPAVMVTASHNPPEYNGYKVYWGNGAQIIPPHDEGIAAAIDRVEPARRGAARSTRPRRARKGCGASSATSSSEAYLDGDPRRCACTGEADATLPSSTRRCTAWAAAWRWRRSGAPASTSVHAVPEQQQPDGAFPTVRFPNPEEKGAMDLSRRARRARRRRTSCSPTTPTRIGSRCWRATRSGELRAAHRQRGRRAARPLPAHPGRRGAQRAAGDHHHRLLARSWAPSRRELGARYDETLTGFKWIANRAHGARAQGRRAASSSATRRRSATPWARSCATRTAIGAALVFADLAAWCQSRGHDRARLPRGDPARVRPLRRRRSRTSPCRARAGRRRSPG